MAFKQSYIINVVGQNVPLAVAGQSVIGIRLAGTFVGTLQFQASTDGLNFYPVTVTPFASGTGVQTATAGGNWFFNVQNYTVFRVVLTAYTSGSVQVYLAASQDGSWQDAFLSPGVLNLTSLASNATNTVTQNAQTNRAWNLQALTITVNGQPAWLTSPNVQIFDGPANTGTLLAQFDLPLSGSAGVNYPIAMPPVTQTNPLGGYTGTPGNAMNIVVAAAGSGKNSIINASFTAA
jgi:hypothetical protein